MRVECHFASVVRIDGFTLPTSTSQLTLFERPHLRAILGIQIDELCADLDVSRALAVLLLHGVMAAERSEFDVAVAAEVKRIVERRHKEGKNRVLLFIESTVPMDVDPNSPHREEHGIVVGFDLVDRDAAARVHREATRGIVAALSLASEQDITTHKLSEGLYCRDAGGKLYLSYTATMGQATLVVSSAQETLATIPDYFDKLKARKDLSRILRLAADAAATSDRFRMWLSAWTALESLITSRFKRYEPIFLDQLRGDRKDAPTLHYFGRLAAVMPERYRLLDKFAIVAACLFPDRAEADLEEFKELKEQRDNVMHGGETTDAELRAEAVRKLLRRYLEGDLKAS